MLVGAGIALILIAVFVLPVEGKPEWGDFWKVKPMIVVTLAGAVGGACTYYILQFVSGNVWLRAIAGLLCVIVYVVGLWMGSVLGLNGTLWN